MKKYLKPYRHLLALGAVLAFALSLFMLQVPLVVCGSLVACYQLSQFALAKRSQRGLVCLAIGSPEQIAELEKILEEFKALGALIPGLKDLGTAEGGFGALKKLPGVLKAEQDRADALHAEVKKLSKQLFENTPTGVRWVNGQPFVTEDCAKYIGALAVIRSAHEHKLKGANAEDLIQRAAGFLNMEAKAAIAATDIPLPVQYAAQIVELVYQYGRPVNSARSIRSAPAASNCRA